MSADSGPLTVLIVGRAQDTAGELRALLAPQGQLTTRIGALDDVGAGDAGVVVVAMGSVPVGEDVLVDRWLGPEVAAPVVVLSELDNDSNLFAALRRGAAGYLLAGLSRAEVLSALQRVVVGQTVVDPGMGGRIAAFVAAGGRAQPPSRASWGLSAREDQILESLLEGRSNREIARHLNLGEETVKSQLRGIYRKLGVRDRSQAIAVTLQARQLPPRPSG